MRFGLFGGARTDPGEQASDSRIYTDYIDYICEAEALGRATQLPQPEDGARGALTQTRPIPAQARTNPGPLLPPRQIRPEQRCRDRAATGQKPPPAALGWGGKPQFDPLRRRERL